MSPFQANYGVIQTLRFEEHSLEKYSDAAKQDMDELKTVHLQLKFEIAKASATQTFHANKLRSCGPDLKEGDNVYLRRRKNIKTKRPSNKLDATKLGPFKIIKKLGPVTYKLKLPAKMRTPGISCVTNGTHG